MIAATFGWLADPALAAVSLRLCVLSAYDARDDAVDYFISYYGEDSAHSIASDSRKEDCDVIVRLTQKGNFLRHGKLTADVESAYSGAKLLHVEKGSLLGDNRAQAAREIKEAIALGTDVFAQVDVERRQAGFSPTATGPVVPSQGFHSSETATSPATPSLLATVSPKFSSKERPDDLAVIIGIEGYSDIMAKAPYAERDAEAMKAYVRALGVPERNIVLLTGSKAVRSALTKNVEGWLPRMAKSDSRVYFYFSGHGAPDVKTGQAYLVPWDGDPNFLDATAYPVAQLYQKLGALPVKQVLVAMDSCFSGAGGRSVLASGARPLVMKIETGTVPARVTSLAASASNEISGSLDDKRHGAFTYFLMEGLNAGQKTPSELIKYLTPRVQDEARRLNRDQTPQLQGDGAWSLR
ncbi:MAG: hypothetical protein A2X40_08140 [Elusimicrobia bacterium GWC2_65_9]|nr:MAG: hypothetical protein A2X40_08140 [Elusimicrobia bacterium GWC2_65_9]OHC66081.1 MAG: hypothetical protein A2040_03835 [Rhodocyclales bacterium GWA2_65_19]